MSERPIHFFGMRKTKSLIAMTICFCVWQVIRIFLPELETNPIYAYIYAIIEMRNSIETEKATSLERIKTNVIGFSVAFAAIALRSFLWQIPDIKQHNVVVEFVIIIIGVLLTINVAELVKCKTLCAIAAMTFIICFWQTASSPYLYAFLRFVQTLIGIGAAFAVNLLIYPPDKTKQ